MISRSPFALKRAFSSLVFERPSLPGQGAQASDIPIQSPPPLKTTLEQNQNQDYARNAMWILALRKKNVTDPRVLRSMEEIPRSRFLPQRFNGLGFQDRSVPLCCGQTALSPSIAGRMIQHLRPEGGEKVLHIGAGSGYKSALLANMGCRVFAIERYHSLVCIAQDAFTSLSLGEDITLTHGDGLEGCLETSCFDAILVSGAVREIPYILIEQLKKSTGRLLVAVGAQAQPQTLALVRNTVSRPSVMPLGSIRLPSITGGVSAY